MSSVPASEQISLKTSETASILCVDLDGTLIKTDTLWECLVLLLKQHPVKLIQLPFWLLLGKASFKAKLARSVRLDPNSLPFDPEILDLLRQRRSQGHRTVLATASDRSIAEPVAAHVGLFDQVIASDGKLNLKGDAKASRLKEAFAGSPFDYVGDDPADVAVWRAAAGAYVVGSRRLADAAAEVTAVKQWYPRSPDLLHCWTSALRVHHWSKNALMFLPVLLAHRWHRFEMLQTALAALLFGICASGVYIFNDVLDLESDRRHPWKSDRPFASGSLSIAAGVCVSGLLISSALLCSALFVNRRFAAVMALYAVLTTWYSLRLKKVVLLDVFVLASFYTVRIWAGALVTATVLSQWFLAFSMFFFLSLAMAKRYSELVHAAELVSSGSSGRDYRADDRELLLNIGVASSFAAIVILSLYVHGPEVLALYHNPGVLLLLCPLVLYWMMRIWLRARRGELNEDPITLALRDPASYAVALLCAIVLALGVLNFPL